MHQSLQASVVELADAVGSTSQLIKKAKELVFSSTDDYRVTDKAHLLQDATTGSRKELIEAPTAAFKVQ
ncbi:hypothetical protein OH492_07870 [Vibrio chagasii]|nr:hypothetical protein [Vibrio chagasii]